MELRLERLWPKDTYTVGRLFVNGQLFCNTLEDRIVDINKNGMFDGGEQKVYAESAIPYGTYQVKYSYSPRFGRNMPRLEDVPSFSGILIHAGNTAKDSAGCILVGLNKEAGRLIQSSEYSKKINDLIADAQKRGERITIEIV